MKALRDNQLRVIEELANGSSIIAAAKRAGVSEQSIHLWKKKPEFREALQNAKEAVEQGRVRVIESIAAERTKTFFPDINSKLQKGGIDAIDFLIEVLNNPEVRTRDRLDCARELLRISGVIESQKILIQSQSIEPGSRRKGISPQTASEIRRKILGIVEDDFVDVDTEAV